MLGHIESLIDGILVEGTRKGVFRTSLFKNPKGMLIAVFSSLLIDARQRNTDDLMNDLLVLIERGLTARARRSTHGSGTVHPVP